MEQGGPCPPDGDNTCSRGGFILQQGLFPLMPNYQADEKRGWFCLRGPQGLVLESVRFL